MIEIAGTMKSFPGTKDISHVASKIYNEVFGITENKILNDPDKILRSWIKMESELFYQFEDIFYRPMYSTPFSSIKDFAEVPLYLTRMMKSMADFLVGKRLLNSKIVIVQVLLT